MIFASVALPTPESASSSFSEALLRSTFEDDFEAPKATVVASMRTAIAENRTPRERIGFIGFLPVKTEPSPVVFAGEGEYVRASSETCQLGETKGPWAHPREPSFRWSVLFATEWCRNSSGRRCGRRRRSGTRRHANR